MAYNSGMFTSTVTDPQGDRWTVELQLIPRREGVGFRERFFRRKSTRRRDPHKTRWYDFIDLPILDGAAELWFLLAVAVAVAIFALIGWPLLLLLSDFIWLIIVLVGALISFGIFGRPVTIVANNGDKTHTWKIRGLLKAQRLRQKIADNLAHGIVLEG
jgi:hypothetical protein